MRFFFSEIHLKKQKLMSAINIIKLVTPYQINNKAKDTINVGKFSFKNFIKNLNCRTL